MPTAPEFPSRESDKIAAVETYSFKVKTGAIGGLFHKKKKK